MSEMIKEFNKGDLLYIDMDGKAQWGFPEGYPYKEGVTFEYDGVTTGKPIVVGTVKISDVILDYETFQKVVVDYYDGEELKASISPMAVQSQGGAYGATTTVIDGGTPMILALMVYDANNELNAETGLYVLAVVDYRAVLRFETIHPMAPESLPSATTTTPGVVKQVPYLPNATGDAPTAENFNQLLRQLKNAGLMK